MRVSYLQFYRMNLNNILESQSFANKAANTISSGKRVNTPSDDPIAASQLLHLNQQITNADQYLRNADFAESRLNIEEDLITSAYDSLSRVRELMIQASNPIHSSNELSAIAQELEQRLDEMAGISNFQDADGDYIFSGFQSKVRPFTKNSSGNYVYNGDDGKRFAEIADGIRVQTSDSGLDVFGNIRRGNGTFYVTESGNSGTAVLKEMSVTDPSSWVVDTYTINFSVSGGNTTYTVLDSNSNTVVPSTAYTSGTPITFNGISIALENAPANGDSFTVSPSAGQSVFSVIQSAINNISNARQSASANAQFNNQLFLSITEIDGALSHLNDVRTQIGGRLNKIDSMRLANEDIKFQAQVSASSLEDLDLVEAITELEKRATALEAAQASFVRIQDLNIFNFL